MATTQETAHQIQRPPTQNNYTATASVDPDHHEDFVYILGASGAVQALESWERGGQGPMDFKWGVRLLTLVDRFSATRVLNSGC